MQPNYPSKEMKELFTAILKLKNPDEASWFFRDLLTIPELTEFAKRWQIVKMLVEKYPYLEIAKTLDVSTTTVTRVAQWLHHGTGGYKLMAQRLLKRKVK